MTDHDTHYRELARAIKQWGAELGFDEVRISGCELEADEKRLMDWLARGWHGEMDYMERHGDTRTRPHKLVPGTVRIISTRLNYWYRTEADGAQPGDVLAQPKSAYISRYALGRDYHKVIRKRLQSLAERIETAIGPFGYRAFCDSAPVLEKAVAANCGVGWLGKHTNILARDGSWFFLGELYTDIPLPVDPPTSAHCGTCTTCIDVCPTQAIRGPYALDARLCISYLTIELKGSIPVELRGAMGNRIFGCDDCQLFCPWNREASTTLNPDFKPRHGLEDAELVGLFAWTEADFDHYTEGSAIRRIGYERWLRNIAVALGNAPTTLEIVSALEARAAHPSPLVREHVAWALAQHRE